MIISPFHPAIMSGILMAALAGCSGEIPSPPAPLDPGTVEAAVTRGAGIDPATYAGDFAMKAPVDIPAEDTSVPVVVYAGLTPSGETRLKMQGHVDLRQMQLQLPKLLTRVIEDNCKHQIALDFTAADAQDDSLRAWGTVNAKFFRCKGDEDDITARGAQYLAPDIDAYAVASAEVVNQCIEIKLSDIQLSPNGFLGGVANLFGLTSIARSVILDKAGAFLAENPICPQLPPELASLAPSYDSGGLREVGDGGISAEFVGSVDTSAETLISLLAVVKEKGLLEERQ